MFAYDWRRLTFEMLMFWLEFLHIFDNKKKHELVPLVWNETRDRDCLSAYATIMQNIHLGKKVCLQK